MLPVPAKPLIKDLGKNQRGRTKAQNAYDAIPGTLVYFKAGQPLVAVGNTLVGGVEVLRALPTSKVARIEYLNASVAPGNMGRDSGTD